MTTASLSPARPSTAHRVLNFSAGPAVLPEAVIRQAQEDL